MTDLVCKICGRKVTAVKRNYGSIHQLFLKHAEYIKPMEAQSEFDWHKLEIED